MRLRLRLMKTVAVDVCRPGSNRWLRAAPLHAPYHMLLLCLAAKADAVPPPAPRDDALEISALRTRFKSAHCADISQRTIS
jgi:hypothetical protein